MIELQLVESLDSGSRLTTNKTSGDNMKVYKMKLNVVKEAIRKPFAWPGGYPIYTVMSDGELLCPECARENYRLIVQDTKDSSGCWEVVGSMVLWEAIDYCAHCHKKLEAAYK